MRLIRALYSAVKAEGTAMQKMMFRLAGYNKFGLKTDDILYESAEVQEAIRRLPEDLYNERAFRMKRALHMSMTHTYLPEEQWVKFEDDDRYLTPYLQEVLKEKEEKENWGKHPQ